MGLELGKINIKRFADGEVYVQLGESVRGCDVFLLQPTCPPVNENFMELQIVIDACRRASAKNITAVIPYFGYARADRKASLYSSVLYMNLSWISICWKYMEIKDYKQNLGSVAVSVVLFMLYQWEGISIKFVTRAKFHIYRYSHLF